MELSPDIGPRFWAGYWDRGACGMSHGRVSLEVQLFKGGKWAINEVMPTEDSARRKAADLLALKTTEGVRIVKEAHFGNDSRRETEIFKEMKEVEKDEDFSILLVDDAPLSEQVEDYYESRARTTMERPFPKYLEKHEMTPFEMLHSHKRLKRIMNKDSIVASAVDKIAALYSRVTGVDASKRKDVIFAAVDRIAAKAREVDSKPLPKAKDLKDERSRAMVDEMMSDILVARTVIKDVISVSKHMGDAVLRMLDPIEGKCQPTKFAADKLVELLNFMFAGQLLPRSKAVLFERIWRDLKSPVRLTNSEEANGDREFFVLLLNRVVTDLGIYGGRPMAVGLTERWERPGAD